MARLMMTRPYRYWLVAALIAALIYYAWGEVTRTRGAQKVSFRPAEETCGASGSLRYCVYRDRRGTNGVGAGEALGIHWGTFQLTDEAREAPRLALASALAAAGLSSKRFAAAQPGNTYNFKLHRP